MMRMKANIGGKKLDLNGPASLRAGGIAIKKIWELCVYICWCHIVAEEEELFSLL